MAGLAAGSTGSRMTHDRLGGARETPCPLPHKVAAVGFPGRANYMAAERLQRRLAAILSADVVGYSRLMGLDEARTLSRLNALRRKIFDPTVAAHSGRIR